MFGGAAVIMMTFTGDAIIFDDAERAARNTMGEDRIPMVILHQITDDIPRDITGTELVPAPDPSSPAFGLWLSLFVIVAAIAILIPLIWHRRRWTKTTTPTLRALQQLDRLQNLQLLAKNQTERHFTLLAGILRRFVQKTFGIAASRQTSREFIGHAARNQSLEKHLSFLTSFLAQCDIAKFAPPSASAQAHRNLNDEFRAWLSALNGGSKSRPSLDARRPVSKMSDS